MQIDTGQEIIEEYVQHLNAREFPCVAARAAISRQQMKCMVAGHMACPKDDMAILAFLYDFVDEYRNNKTIFHSASVIFTAPGDVDEKMFDSLLWSKLQSLSNLDRRNFKHDTRVDDDPASPKFSFSIKEEAFFIIALHPNNSRKARRFKTPVLAFNPHAQFEQLRQTGGYEKMKSIVRKRDLAYSGSVNPMLRDFGNASEVYQYSGQQYDESWQCPLKFI